ncbi:MAG TPA: lamin tail domain-containing protein [Thiobacillaceae bacterium]|nr:lamin tail domain-containing protein [Thiobacillaceae bacterium]
MNKLIQGLALLIAGAAGTNTHAAIIISEAAPWSSEYSPIGADWFELTNTGASAVDITGWRMDDGSASFAASVALTGVTTIPAGQSVIFIEGDGSINASFIDNWFGNHPQAKILYENGDTIFAPAELLIGNYDGSNVDLSIHGDGINIYDANGGLQATVSFGQSAMGYTFDYDSCTTGTIPRLSVHWVCGAFAAINSPVLEVGSPGNIAPVPEPETYVLMLAGLGIVSFAAKRRKLATRT